MLTNADNVYYPCNDWEDFGATILSWWIVKAKELLGGAVLVNLEFMEGPYELQIRSRNMLLSVTGTQLDEQWDIPLMKLVDELVTAAQLVAAKLQELNIADETGLAIGGRELRRASMRLPEYLGE